MRSIDGIIRSNGLHPSRTVVLVPYAQLMQEASEAWKAHVRSDRSSMAGASFVPRFESSMNWAASLSASEGGFQPSGDDIRFDPAFDLLTASALLQRAGFAAQQDILAGRLVEAALALARQAAAITPESRPDWGLRLATEWAASLESPALALESAIGRIALAWAASSSYATDVLFTAEADALIVLEGFQSEPLVEALKSCFADRGTANFPVVFWQPSSPGKPSLHPALDSEDEAQRAAACVMAHLAANQAPVALIAQDRVLTRRIRAMLAEKGVVLRDETGWKLSTTRAAASLMSLLRALPWDASTDVVMDWIKHSPAFSLTAVTAAETALRKTGARAWSGLPLHLPPVAALHAQAEPVRESLQRGRPLVHWLRDLRSALQASGQWQVLATDVAGSGVLAALHLDEGAEMVFADTASHTARMTQRDFSNWASQALEAASFTPVHPPEAQVVILPLSQLLGRHVGAVVLPGADEMRLPVSPEPPGMWTPAQRLLLGLPTREQAAATERAAWQHALQMPAIDVLWRTSEEGERLMPSGFVQEVLLLQPPGKHESAADPRVARSLDTMPTPRPLPTGEKLPVARLSASAYEDLRRCPYRFFALRQLKLQEPAELDGELGKRDFGNWLHTLLKHFHEALRTSPTTELNERLVMIDAAAAAATQELALSDSEFLPFAASWPRVRAGYLEWLVAHEAGGAVYDEGEEWKEMPLGDDLTLFGKIDRIDKMPDGSRVVMDYKTEPRTVTQDRIRGAGEDTQLVFYGALLADDTLAGAYVNIGEKEATKSYVQEEITGLRDELIDGILTDMARIARAAPLPALGEGMACAYCAARGLCRKDFWS
ncbi:MAG: PD-(D/E)XK nuclease family protein [Comamonadaceae bacterium]|nr:MAG: PD-(D/E)XK nuclease family protein [Comamonadaceae bacterium]